MKADFLRFPLLSFSAGASSSPRPPGPMLLLRVLREDFRGDNTGALNDVFAIRPSAMFSLPSVFAMVYAKSWWGVTMMLLGTESQR